MIDGFGREISYLRLSVTELCNLRCRYCMPAEGVCKKTHEQMLTQEETVTAVEVAASLGVRKLRVTGGEPLVKRGIVSLCERLSAIDGIEELCITTNGLLLPQLAKPLRAAGVRRVNISLDTLDPARYEYITRGGDLAAALRGVEAALDAGFERVKLNAVLIGGFNDAQIPALAELTRTWGVDMRFIELMPMVDKGFAPEAYVPVEAVTKALPQLQPEPSDGGVARLYRLPGAAGRIGLISPLSAHFCALCNRLRLTADGKLKPCLHSAEEFSIKGLDPEAMRAQFERAVMAKPARHKALSAAEHTDARRAMSQIGG